MNYQSRVAVRRSSASGTPARSYLNSAVLTLLLYVIGFGIVGLIVNPGWNCTLC